MKQPPDMLFQEIEACAAAADLEAYRVIETIVTPWGEIRPNRRLLLPPGPARIMLELGFIEPIRLSDLSPAPRASPGDAKPIG